MFEGLSSEVEDSDNFLLRLHQVGGVNVEVGMALYERKIMLSFFTC